MRFLVTGGAGFIGSNCVEYLLDQGHQVRVMDNLSTGKMENLKEFIAKIEFMQASVEDTVAVKEAVQDIDYIIHLAAIPSVQYSVEEPLKANESMITATLTLFKAAVDIGSVKRIVQAASAAAYGDGPELPKRETMLPEPLSPYAAAKLGQEYYGSTFSKVYGLEVTSLRFFNVYGPKQDPRSPYSGVISIFISRMLAKGKPTVFGDGSNTRDFVYVGDVVAGIYQACLAEWTGQSEVINIGTGQQTSLNTLLATINDLLEGNIAAIYTKPRTGDILHSYADISKAQRLLAFQPKLGIREGLEKLIAFVKLTEA
ncbi:MAG: LPS biosynthesis protein WbpP [Firmicutes bacterium HGW-Firmicutes-12]|jgi:UDP-glucose 4-epimerase|nr:MAG: LPS biosynthesis protein WbpP [Firmicutes bacterium HGW-Firmicutes-12]